jgi:hypothetical protein
MAMLPLLYTLGTLLPNVIIVNTKEEEAAINLRQTMSYHPTTKIQKSNMNHRRPSNNSIGGKRPQPRNHHNEKTTNATITTMNTEIMESSNEKSVLATTASNSKNNTQAMKDSSQSQQQQQQQRPHPHAGARDVNGNLGYIADPTALKRGRQAYLQQHPSNDLNGGDDNNDYWQILEGDYFNSQNATNDSTTSFVYYDDEILSPDYICAFGPGQGIEEDSGFKLLVDKIRIFEETPTTIAASPHRPPRLFCGIYTYSAMRPLVRTQALSWGYKCDGFLAFSNETLPDLGMVDLLHQGTEEYDNMWQKTRSIWAYIHDHYLDDYDYFHLGGDDMYVIVENLRRYLKGLENSVTSNTTNPLYFGQWLPSRNIVAGGPGYTLNAAAVQRLVQDALPYCHAHKRVAFEDRMMALCFQDYLTITGNETDTRDLDTGEQRYHDETPASLFTFRATSKSKAPYLQKTAYAWQSLEHPSIPNTTVGPKHELEAAARFSISFHHLYNPQYVARFHAILHPRTCPAKSALGKGLRRQQRTVMH